MNQADKVTISRIVKVNHAGEYGAIRIYRAQIWVARLLYPEIVAFLMETLEHEINHCALFRSAMPERNSRPCRIMGLWGNGGLVLDFVTSLFGRQGIWICTAAVEKAVHHHLEDQLFFLKDKDPALYSLIKDIQAEELSHLQHAEDNITVNSSWARLLTCSITLATDAVIWLSTWGDSSKMTKSLRDHVQGK
ncbi:ubiquinone biosynthesis protein UbiB [Kiloniella spongiae]|uniref:Ubiquinone biosynthesis protein UbiB n=1 Tax=Kiloniella spongiae TaxID=1489064 RepID=A0A0H2MU64_9PROT|nr:demethoxyubiquinone hydroxylase family protein [Kiloniella spongiae]KLN60255.1 ubiquinone biosynthesis protein UbiB [Kiloniella spongiae]